MKQLTRSDSAQQVSFQEDAMAGKVRKTFKQQSVFDSWDVGERYEVLENLGKGSYGAVAKATDRYTGKVVAIKQMKRIFDEPTDAKRAYREMHILRHLQHPSIVALYDVVSSGHQILPAAYSSLLRQQAGPVLSNMNLYLVMEFVDTDLSKVLKSQQYLTEEHVSYLMLQLLAGLQYLHSRHVIHRDLKPANILVSCVDCRLKIADFGLSRVVTEEEVGVGLGQGGQAVLPARLSPDHHGHRSSDSAADSVGSDEEAVVTDGINFDNLPHPPAFGSLPQPPLPAPIPLRRGLTRHVVTRWYRAPEVILLQPYSNAVDLWSAGCIFAELMGLIQTNVKDFRSRRALFPGESCGELSAEDLKAYMNPALPPSSYISTATSTSEAPLLSHRPFGALTESSGQDKSQLNVIFDVLGTPSPQDLSDLPASLAQSLAAFPHRPARSLAAMFPGSHPLAIDLLEALLKFNPAHRKTAREALQHAFFEHLHGKPYVRAYVQSTSKAGGRAEGEEGGDTLDDDGSDRAGVPVVTPPVLLGGALDKEGEALKKQIVEEVNYYRLKEAQLFPDRKLSLDSVSLK